MDRRWRLQTRPAHAPAWLGTVLDGCRAMPHADQAARLAEWASRGPRYTSYPPATEFEPTEPAFVKRELAEVAEQGELISLYVHVPFCRSLCWYCGCNVIPTRDKSRGAEYVDELATEMAALSRMLHRAPVTELAIGGGSPNFLSPETLRAMIAALERNFAIVRDARRSIELDPRTTTAAQIDTLAAAGFRSLSMGVQDFSEAVQDAIHRHQTVVQTRGLVELARRAGFNDVNVDVVYGLPHQTETSFARTLDAVVDLAPDRIALFGYAHLPDRLAHQRLVERAGRVLDSYERARLLLLAIQQLTDVGYIHLGLDHFAKPGSRLAQAAAEHRLVRTFQGYAEHRADAVLGLGVSAISSTPRMHWQNHSDLETWRRDVDAGKLPVSRGLLLDRDDCVRRAVINRLMCDGEVDLRRISIEYDLDGQVYFARELAALDRLSELAIYDAATRTVRTTPTGRLLVRNVCMVFDRYHHDAGVPGVQPARFSPTI
jgi:oxygen-independent coproporphyrinogen-3 oxidase